MAAMKTISSVVMFVCFVVCQSTVASNPGTSSSASQDSTLRLTSHELDLADLSLPPEVITEALFNQVDLFQDQLEQCEESVRNNLKGDDTPETGGIDIDYPEDENDEYNDDDDDNDVDAEETFDQQIAQLAVDTFGDNVTDFDDPGQTYETTVLDNSLFVTSDSSTQAVDQNVIKSMTTVSGIEAGNNKNDIDHGTYTDNNKDSGYVKQTADSGNENNEQKENNEQNSRNKGVDGIGNKEIVQENGNNVDPTGREEESTEDSTGERPDVTTTKTSISTTADDTTSLRDIDSRNSDMEEIQARPDEVVISRVVSEAVSNNTSQASVTQEHASDIQSDIEGTHAVAMEETTVISTIQITSAPRQLSNDKTNKEDTLADVTDETFTTSAPTLESDDQTSIGDIPAHETTIMLPIQTTNAPLQLSNNQTDTEEIYAGMTDETSKSAYEITNAPDPTIEEIYNAMPEGNPTNNTESDVVSSESSSEPQPETTSDSATQSDETNSDDSSEGGRSKRSVSLLDIVRANIGEREFEGKDILRAIMAKERVNTKQSSRHSGTVKTMDRVNQINIPVEEVLMQITEEESLSTRAKNLSPETASLGLSLHNRRQIHPLKTKPKARRQNKHIIKQNGSTGNKHTQGVIKMAETFVTTQKLARPNTKTLTSEMMEEKRLTATLRNPSKANRVRRRRSVGHAMSPERYVPLIDQLVERLKYLQHSLSVCHMLLPKDQWSDY